MNYIKLYYAFVENFKNQMFKEGAYTEVHHILPRYAGGTDDSNNLVRLTYRQHVFLHKLWWKATGDVQAESAYLLMANIPEDKKIFLCSQAGKIGGAKNKESGHIKMLSDLYGSSNGKRNVESGLLEKIRVLANTPERQRKLKLLHEEFKLNGHYDRLIKAGNDAWRGQTHTEEYKRKKSEDYKQRFTSPDNRDALLKSAAKGRKSRSEKSKRLAEEVIENALRIEEFLHKTLKRSLYYYISPEGLKFHSATYASRYYGGVKPATIDNWCKREMYGWKREPKDSV